MAKSKKKKSDADPLERDMSFLIKEKGKWVRLNDLFQLQKKNKTITLRVSDDLLNEVKKIAKDDDIDYQKLIRNILIEYVSKRAS
ncbi:CopG family antitoxin [Bdellovibrio sp. HCB185ZH]|uniref:CopG family antitoxin n=1 Tax=Bdellovibrio sp. HCB185ZH TaxID=3394235 RepID=UPI0039A6F7DC